MSKQGKNLELIKEVIIRLSIPEVLDKKYRDHFLLGSYKDKREGHITPDWLLIYEINKDELVLYRTGSHSELFNK